MKVWTVTDTRGRSHSINVGLIERYVVAGETETELRLVSGQTIRVPLSRGRCMTLISRLPVI